MKLAHFSYYVHDYFFIILPNFHIFYKFLVVSLSYVIIPYFVTNIMDLFARRTFYSKYFNFYILIVIMNVLKVMCIRIQSPITFLLNAYLLHLLIYHATHTFKQVVILTSLCQIIRVVKVMLSCSNVSFFAIINKSYRLQVANIQNLLDLKGDVHEKSMYMLVFYDGINHYWMFW